MTDSIENQIDPLAIKKQIVIMSVLILISLGFIPITDKWQFGALVLLLYSFILINFTFFDITRFPIQVEIRNVGIALRFKISKPRSYEWSRIADIFLPTLSPDKKQYGSFRIKGNSRPYHVKPNVAYQIDVPYYDATGAYLPRWEGREGSKVIPARPRDGLR